MINLSNEDLLIKFGIKLPKDNKVIKEDSQNNFYNELPKYIIDGKIKDPLTACLPAKNRISMIRF